MSHLDPPIPPPQLEYAGFHDERPGLVTAIGIVSIVVSSLSVLSALYSGLMLIPMLMMSSMGGMGGGGPGMASAVTPAGTVTAADASAIVAALNGQSPLSTADQATLAAALGKMEVPLAPPADGNWTAAHVNGQVSGYSVTNFGGGPTTSYNLNGGGSLQVNAGNVTFNYFDAQGGFVNATYGPGGVVSTTSLGVGGGPFGRVSKLGIAVQATSFAASLALAGLLMAAGIQMVRGRPSGRTLHVWWAWPKLAAAVLAAASTYLWLTSFMGGMGTGGPPWQIPWVYSGVSLAVAVAWPITVLFLLRTRGVRRYFADA